MYDFLNNFQQRMKNVASSALLHRSIVYKDTLSSRFGFRDYDEQLNLVYALLKFIMDKSLKEEDCTLDDMAVFLEEINLEYFNKNIKREDYFDLANFIVNEIILNDGERIFFKCLNTEKKEYIPFYAQLINHKRTVDSNLATYYLTEQGYNLLLSTLEFEDNMKLTVQELIFKINLENKDYDKALQDVKNIFALSRKQVQYLLDSIMRIKENIITFTVEEYEDSIQENIKVIKEQDKKFKAHKQEVERREKNLIELHLEERDNLDEEEKNKILEKISKLSEIKKELSRITFEHSKVINMHYEFKEVYTNALIKSIEFSKRNNINIKEDLEDAILKDLSKIDLIHLLMKPLYLKNIPKIYDIECCLMPQKNTRIEKEKTEEIILTMDEEQYLKEKEEKEKKAIEKNEKYKNILKYLFVYALNNSLEYKLSDVINDISSGYTKEKELFISNFYMLREVLIELLSMKNIKIDKLKEDKKKISIDSNIDSGFEPLRTILELIDENKEFKKIDRIEIKIMGEDEEVKISHKDERLDITNLMFSFYLNVE